MAYQRSKRISTPALQSSLQDKLDAITARTRTLVQSSRLAISEDASTDLFNTGIEDRILAVGGAAPEFTLNDAQTGRAVHSTDLVGMGPLILNFFRGRWCPYCVTELEAWRDLHPALRELKAMLVAISPQTQRHNDFTLQQHELPFPILSDPGALVAEKFGIAYTVPEAARRYYQSILVNIPNANSGATYATASESSWRLPLPAVFLIEPNPNSATGIITFAEAHADYRVRPEPAEVLGLIRERIAR